jgi:hypothetical protein
MGKCTEQDPRSTTLEEVLAGEAVFVHDTTFNENHQGRTTGMNPAEMGFDYVQKMMNHIIVPLRTPVTESNIKNTIDVDGYYGDKTKQAVEALINGGADPTGTTLVDTNVSHHEDSSEGSTNPNTLLKLAKDYSGIDGQNIEAEYGKVIDKEILVGLDQSGNDIHPTELDENGKSDVGIYELYKNNDWDEDGISNYVEVENNTRKDGTNLTFNPLEVDTGNQVIALINSTPRGYHYLGEMVKGTANINTPDFNHSDQIDGLRIPSTGKGYYYFRSADVKDTDNYAILSTLQKIEEVGKKWARLHPDLVPLNINVFPADGGTGGIDPGGSGGIRFGVGDFSLPGGRSFIVNGVQQHNTHQNGLDVDVRYMRKENAGEGNMDFRNTIQYNDYDETLTKELISLFAEAGAIDIYVDLLGRDKIFSRTDENGDEIPGIYEVVTFPNRSTAFVRRVVDHYNHFHVKFPLTNPPSGIILTSTADTIRANETDMITISSDPIKDSKSWPVLNGTILIVTVTDQSGNSIGQIIEGVLYYRGGRRIAVNSEGKLVFTYKAGNTQGIATIRVWADYGKTGPAMQIGEKQITITEP